MHEPHPAATFIAFSMSAACWSGKALISLSTRSASSNIRTPAFASPSSAMVQRSTRLHKLAEELRLSQIVEWVRWVPHTLVREYYRSADVFLFPSLRDSGGMAVLEAMAHGLPVVCTDLGGPGVIVNQDCGRVVFTGRKSREQLVSGLVDALREIATTPALHDSLAAGASARARQFKFETLVDSLHPPVPLPNTTPIT